MAVRVSVALAQIGEFSFIVAVSIVSIVVNPLLFRGVAGLQRRTPRRAGEAAVRTDDIEAPPDAAHRAIIVGYGPTGRVLTRLLRENGLEAAVIELNMATVRALRDEGVSAVYGDATNAEALRAAGVGSAAHLILSASMPENVEVIRAARALNPRIRASWRAPRRCASGGGYGAPGRTSRFRGRRRWPWRWLRPRCSALGRPRSRSIANARGRRGTLRETELDRV